MQVYQANTSEESSSINVIDSVFSTSKVDALSANQGLTLRRLIERLEHVSFVSTYVYLSGSFGDIAQLDNLNSTKTYFFINNTTDGKNYFVFQKTTYTGVDYATPAINISDLYVRSATLNVNDDPRVIKRCWFKTLSNVTQSLANSNIFYVEVGYSNMLQVQPDGNHFFPYPMKNDY